MNYVLVAQTIIMRGSISMFLKDDLITLRAIESKDAEILLKMINDPEIELSVIGWSYPVSERQQLEWINNIQSDKAIRFIIDYQNRAVGTAIISNVDYKNRTANLNVKIPLEERGKGFASHAVNLMICYCFDELGINCITASILYDNKSSRSLFEKMGFHQEGVLRQRIYKNGVFKDLIPYSLLRDDYEKRNWK